MIYMRDVKCPHCGARTELALAVLALKDITGVIQIAKCKNCDNEFNFKVVITAEVIHS